MKFEKLSHKKFKGHRLASSSLRDVSGGATTATEGGVHSIGQNMSETYNSDTRHENGGISWETSDICEGWYADES